MERIAFSKFKDSCLSLLERVKMTGEPLMVTKKGEPIALVTHPSMPLSNKAFGCMEGTISIKGDIVSPLSENDWEVFNS